MLCGALTVSSAMVFCMAAALSRIACATLVQSASSGGVIFSAVWRLVIRCSTVSGFVAMAPAPTLACGTAPCVARLGAALALSARAADIGLASIVAPNRAAIANERANGAGVASGWKKRDMGISF